MRLNREQILKEYNKKIDAICDANEHKTHFTAKECVYIVCQVIEEIREGKIRNSAGRLK